ncbi:MAG: hypothetical protein NXI20_17390 [bacterium]|nr:hypothetical protein [bacterium]
MRNWKQGILRLDNLMNNVPTWLIIFLLSIVNFLSFQVWPNEQNNFTIAKHFIDPSWMQDSFSLNQWHGPNYIYWTIAGWGLKYLSFTQFGFITRLVNYLLYAIPLGKLFKKLKFSNFGVLLFLQIIFLYQDFLSGEWIWGGFEGKTMAYIFIFWSILMIYESKYLSAVVLIAVATYCHVLVGGWFFLGFLLFTFIESGLSKNLLKWSLLYSSTVAPYAIYILLHLLNSQTIEHEPSADWIYVFFRNPHHAVPTLAPKFWEHNWFAVFVMSTSLYWLKKGTTEHKAQRLAASFNLIILSAIAISYIDEDGTLLKYYLFRMTTIALFFTLLALSIHLKEIFTGESVVTASIKLIKLCIILILVYQGVRINLDRNIPKDQKLAYDSFIEFAKRKTSDTSVFLFINYNDKSENIQFIVDAERERFVSFKMVPEGDEAIIEWYNRIQLRNQLQKSQRLSDDWIDKYGINYIVSKTKILDESPVFENDFYHVYAIK